MDNTGQIYGIRTVIEAIKANRPVDKVFIQKGLQGSLHTELEDIIKKENVSASYVPVQKLNRLCDKNHQGVVAQMSPVEFQPFEELVLNSLKKESAPLFLLLDQISDVRNFGAIIRTAECAGVNGIVIQNKGAARVNADTVKTSAGAIFKVPISKVAHLKDAVYYLQASGIQVIGATEKTNQSLYDLDLSIPVALVMGSEDTGISPSLLKIMDHKAKLPMMGTIESLNVSVACGIVLYEILRQRT